MSSLPPLANGDDCSHVTRSIERQRRIAAKARPAGPRHLYPYVCFACRKSFRRSVGLSVKGLPDKVCPECGGRAIGLSRKFKAPARSSAAQWAKVEYLVRHGFRFASL